MEEFMSVKDKEKAIYELLVDKLYHFFVTERREARVDTVVQILSILKPVEINETEVKDEKKNFEEVDII